MLNCTFVSPKPCSLSSCSPCRSWEMSPSSSESSACCRKGWTSILMSTLLSSKPTSEVRWVLLHFLPVRVSGLYTEVPGGSSPGESVMQRNKTGEHTGKSQTGVAACMSPRTAFVLPASKPPEADVAISIFQYLSLRLGTNSFPLRQHKMFAIFFYCLGTEVVNFSL